LVTRKWLAAPGAVLLLIGSTAAYAAAFWSADFGLMFAIQFDFKSGFFVLLTLVEAGLIGGLVGTSLLAGTLAGVCAEFRRINWKGFISVGVAAGALLVIGGYSEDLPVLKSFRSQLFIFLWQFCVGLYLSQSVYQWQMPSLLNPRRLPIGKWIVRALWALTILSLLHIALAWTVALAKKSGQAPPSTTETPSPTTAPEQPTPEQTPVVTQSSQGWPSSPALPGEWVTLNPQEQEMELQRLRQGTGGEAIAREDISRIRTLPLTFYDGVDLCEAEVQTGNLHGVRIYLRKDQATTVLDGTSPPIHAFNHENSLRLNNASQATSYARFFCSFLQGEDGTFRVVEQVDDLPWQTPSTDAERS
jgi:hypothetical protein